MTIDRHRLLSSVRGYHIFRHRLLTAATVPPTAATQLNTDTPFMIPLRAPSTLRLAVVAINLICPGRIAQWHGLPVLCHPPVIFDNFMQQPSLLRRGQWARLEVGCAFHIQHASVVSDAVIQALDALKNSNATTLVFHMITDPLSLGGYMLKLQVRQVGVLLALAVGLVLLLLVAVLLLRGLPLGAVAFDKLFDVHLDAFKWLWWVELVAAGSC